MSSSPPSLLVRTLTVTVGCVALLLSAIFIALTINTRSQARQNVATMLEATQRVVGELERLRQHHLRTQAMILSENPTLKAAIDTFAAEAALGDKDGQTALIATVRNELGKLATQISADVIVLVSPQAEVLASVGVLATAWPPGSRPTFEVDVADGGRDGVIRFGDRVYRSVWVDLQIRGTTIATLYVSTVLNDDYARELSRASNAQIAIVRSGMPIAGTLPPRLAGAFSRAVTHPTEADGTVTLGKESFAFRQLTSIGAVRFYALDSIDARSAPATAAALRTLAFVAFGAVILALAGSFWLAQTVSRPIGQLSRAIEHLAATHDLRGRLVPTGTSRELDTLTETFNDLMLSLSFAEEATDAAYTGAIRALAAALDARDPYTAGHSERVSLLSVAIGETLQMDPGEIEVLRLGALLHDIGKIGVPDAVLRKPGSLIDAEHQQIRQHPVLGARILRSVPFLAPHLPIVELHHERPDGRGYPYGLTTDGTPLAARIVHVADAYDAITSARAYRPGRSDEDAIAELRRCAGTEYDARIVEALARSRRATTNDSPAPPDPVPVTVARA